jgi:hypothetical protein
MNSASLCSLAGRYDNPFPPRFLAPIDFLKIPALPSRFPMALEFLCCFPWLLLFVDAILMRIYAEHMSAHAQQTQIF